MHSVSLAAAPADASQRAPYLDFLRRALREPLFRFVVLGVLIFLAAHTIEEVKRESQANVVVDGALKQRLANLYVAQFGVRPSSAQLGTIVEEYVDDEVLYREALKLGLDQDDEIIRRRLIQKLQFLQRDSSVQTAPTQAQLRAYYEDHRSQFSEGARVSFTHLYFSPDRGGDADAFARATRAREVLVEKGGEPNADAFALQDSYSSISQGDAARLFGASTFAATLLTQQMDRWSHPVRSGFGWHLVKVTAFEPARLAPYEEVAADVRAAYLQELAAGADRKQLNALRVRYHVRYAGSESGEAR